MAKEFKLYFGPAKCKRFKEALEAVRDHPKLKIVNPDDPKKLYYELTLSDDSVDELAFYSKLIWGLGWRKLPTDLTEIEYKWNGDVHEQIFPHIWKTHFEILKLLEPCGYTKVIDEYGTLGYSEKLPPDPVGHYEDIRRAIQIKDYDKDVRLYYKNLGDSYYGPVHPELVYLKRLGEIELIGRDLFYSRPESSMDEFLKEHLAEYVACIDEELKHRKSEGKATATNVLIKEAPTIEGVEAAIKKKIASAVVVSKGNKVARLEIPRNPTARAYLRDGEVKSGRLFDQFPNPFLCTRRYIYASDKVLHPLTTFTPEMHKNLVTGKGFQVGKFERCWFRRRKNTQLDDTKKMSDLQELWAWTDGVDYTGKEIILDGKKFFEVERKHDGLLVNTDYLMLDHNPLEDICDEILRDSENRLRVRHGLPKVGEGWVSETKLYNLVKALFGDAKQHARPKWLGQQHLDIFVASRSLAIEYHGSQHFEAVDYFGGEESLANTRERDKRKRQKCKKAKVKLIEWHHETAINGVNLRAILEENGIKLG